MFRLIFLDCVEDAVINSVGDQIKTPIQVLTYLPHHGIAAPRQFCIDLYHTILVLLYKSAFTPSGYIFLWASVSYG